MAGTPAQLAEARKIAERRRYQRGVLREAIRSGEVEWFDVIVGNTDPVVEEVVKHLKLRRLLPMIRGIGTASTLELIHRFDAQPDQRLGEFSLQERRDLAFMVKGTIDVWSL